MVGLDGNKTKYTWESGNNSPVNATIANTTNPKTALFSLDLKKANVAEGNYQVTTSLISESGNVLASMTYTDNVSKKGCSAGSTNPVVNGMNNLVRTGGSTSIGFQFGGLILLILGATWGLREKNKKDVSVSS